MQGVLFVYLLMSLWKLRYSTTEKQMHLPLIPEIYISVHLMINAFIH